MTRVAHSGKTPIDPIFTIPIGAEDEFTYTREIEDDVDYSFDGESSTDDTDISFEFEEDEGMGDENSSEVLLETPTEFTIISQTLRRAPGGQQVIDVVIEVEDIAGATEYEIKVTKI